MRILLVRHGESEGNADRTAHAKLADHAIPLTSKGEEQAKAAGQALVQFYEKIGKYPVRMWNSPYKRARQTADIIEQTLKSHNMELAFGRREHINLSEQNHGLFDGLSSIGRELQYPQEFAHVTKCEEANGRFWARLPLGESRFDLAVRVHETFGTFHRDYEKHRINDLIVVAHGTTNRAFVMQWLHLPYEWFESEPNPKNCSIRLLEDGEDLGYIHAGGPL